MPYEIDHSFNGTSLWRNKYWAELCPDCSVPTNQWTARYEEGRKPTIRADLSLTADGITVASKKFKKLYEEHGFKGLEFVELSNGYFGLRVARHVRYDPENFKLHQEDWCDTCKRHRKNLVRTYVPLLAPDEQAILADEFVASEMEFGDHKLRFKDLLVGDKIHALMVESGMKGFGYNHVEQPKFCSLA